MSVLTLENKLQAPKIEKSTFDLSHTHATAGKLGELIPVMCEEVVPGDEFKIKLNHIIRMLPLAGVLQTRVDMYVHAFFVANRTICTDWEEIITGRSSNTIPTENLNNVNIAQGSIGDYYGLPISGAYTGGDVPVSKLPLEGYHKIYNDYYRNKIIQVGTSSYSYADNPIHRNWRKDYFTSALPYPQLGNPSAVSINISYLEEALATNPDENPSSFTVESTANDGRILIQSTSLSTGIINIDEATVPVNEIKYAYAYQDWLARMLKGGDDYSDHLLYVFGVNSSDKRLQKAEYIGGYQTPIVVNDVTQMTPVLDNLGDLYSPQGTQSGIAHSFGNSGDINYFVEEHGYIHVIVSIIPKSSYYGGIARHFSKTTALDFFFPQFAYLPEQEILNKELFVTGALLEDEATFGYIERYAEYKHRNDRISNAMAKDFNYLNFTEIPVETPTLNSTFITCTPREDAFAVQNTIHFFGQFGFDIKATRPMPFNVDDLTIM